MIDATTAQGVLFASLLDRPVHMRFDQPAASSNGGALLLKAVDDRLGLSAALAGCLRDERDPSQVTHTMLDLLRQRIFLLGEDVLLAANTSYVYAVTAIDIDGTADPRPAGFKTQAPRADAYATTMCQF